MTSKIITLTEAEHNELIMLLLRYSIRSDHWAISSGLKLAVADAKSVAPP